MRLNAVLRVGFVASVLVVCAFSVQSVRADGATTTNLTSYNGDPGVSGTQTTTIQGNTTTTVTNVSGTATQGVIGEWDSGNYVELTRTTTTIGNPTTSQTIVETKKLYDKKGGKLKSQTKSNITRSNYNDAGGYSQRSSVTVTIDGQPYARYEEDTERDAGGNSQSGTQTYTILNPDGTKKSEKKSVFKDGNWQEVAQNSTPNQNVGTDNSETTTASAQTSPDQQSTQNQPTEHHSILGWVLGAVGVAAIFVATGDHNNSNDTNSPPPAVSAITFSPTSLAGCRTATATAMVREAGYSGPFSLSSTNGSVAQPASPTTTGSFGIAFGTAEGSATITATDNGGRKGHLSVTVNC